MEARFRGVPVTLQIFKGKTFSMCGFELDGVLWLMLDAVLDVFEELLQQDEASA